MSTVAKLPQWAVRPTLSHASTFPASAPSVPPEVRLYGEPESDRPRDLTPAHTASSGTRSVLHPRSASFTTVAFVPSVSASLKMTSL
jgi:hypothetical protein